MTGCLKEATPSHWTVTGATDPVPSSANAPPAKEIPATPPAGKNVFALIGVSEFNLPAHRDHTVIIKGLFIKATPMSRVNMTSVTTMSPACVPSAPMSLSSSSSFVIAVCARIRPAPEAS